MYSISKIENEKNSFRVIFREITYSGFFAIKVRLRREEIKSFTSRRNINKDEYNVRLKMNPEHASLEEVERIIAEIMSVERVKETCSLTYYLKSEVRKFTEEKEDRVAICFLISKDGAEVYFSSKEESVTYPLEPNSEESQKVLSAIRAFNESLKSK